MAKIDGVPTPPAALNAVGMSDDGRDIILADTMAGHACPGVERIDQAHQSRPIRLPNAHTLPMSQEYHRQYQVSIRYLVWLRWPIGGITTPSAVAPSLDPQVVLQRQHAA